MAYEKMDKAAIAKMAEQYDKETTPPKMGWFGRLIASFGGIETVSREEEYYTPSDYQMSNKSQTEYRGSFSPGFLGSNESEMTISFHERYGSNYSPMVGSDD